MLATEAQASVRGAATLSIGLVAIMFIVSLGNIVDLNPGVDLIDGGPNLYGEPGASPTKLASKIQRFSLYVAIGSRAPGAEVVVAGDVAVVEERWFYGIGRARQVRTGELPGRELSSGASGSDSGIMWGTAWELYLSSSSPELLYIRMEDDKIVAREIASLDKASAPGTETPNDSGSVLRSGLKEGVTAALIALFGMLLTTNARVSIVAKLAAGFLLGVAALAMVGVFQPGGSLPLWSATIVLLLLFAATRERQIPLSRNDLLIAVIASASFLVVAAATRMLGLVAVTPDSFRYLSGGAAMAEGQLSPGMLDAKQMIGQQSIHAPLFYLGADGFLSLGVIVLIVSLVILFEFVRSVLRPLGGNWPIVVASSVVLVALSSRPLWIMAAYINAHMLVAGLLLLGGYLWHLRLVGEIPCPSALVLLGLILSGVVLLRPEGVLLVGAVLIGMIGTDCRPSPRWPWRLMWTLPGVSGVVWYSTLIAIRGFESAPVALLLASLVVTAAGFISPPSWMARALQIGSLLFLWTLVVLVWILADEKVTFFSMIQQNIFEGQGRWGLLGAGIGLIFFAVHVLLLVPGTSANPVLVWPVILFVPILMLSKLGDGAHAASVGPTFLFDMLSEGGGRVGWGDSVNRMWTHIVLLVPVLFSACVLQLFKAAPAGRVVRVGVSVGTAAVLAGFLALWQPVYLQSRWVEWSPYLVSVIVVTLVFSASRDRQESSIDQFSESGTGSASLIKGRWTSRHEG